MALIRENGPAQFLLELIDPERACRRVNQPGHILVRLQFEESTQTLVARVAQMELSPRPRAWFDMEIGGRPAGRIEFELFSEIVPRTAENFRCLATGECGGGLHYESSRFHRVIRNFMIQGGDFNRGDGTGGESIYGTQFDDESFALKHDAAYMLSMANRGSNTNGSQFFVTLRPTPHLDGRHVVFGRAISGHQVIDTIAKVAVDRSDRPLVEVVIAACGADPLPKQQRVQELPPAPAPTETLPAVKPEEEENEECEAELEEEVELPAGNDVPARLLRLRMLVNKGRKQNAAAVKDERVRKKEERQRGVGARERAEERKQTKDKWEADLQLRGVSSDQAYLLETAETAARRYDKHRLKEKRQAAFGWDVFNADSLQKAYEKRLDQLPIGPSHSEQDDDDPLVYGQQPPTKNDEALDRMVAELEQREQRKATFSRRRAFVPEADVDYINERNKVFNKKIKRAYSKYTVEIRQNLERGTAI